MKSPMSWVVGHSDSDRSLPQKMFPAAVPGAVQLDYAKAHHWPNYWYADNFKQYAWMEDVFWHYVTTLKLPAHKNDESIFFVCKGIDYKFEIRLNGRVLRAQEGMFTPVEMDITSIAKEGDELEVVIWPAPKIPGRPADRTQAAHTCKPPVSYGWDWHPRLIPLGIWDDCYLEVRAQQHLQDVELRYSLSEDLSRALVRIEALTSIDDKNALHWTLRDPSGNIVTTGSEPVIKSVATAEFELNAPILWWPHDHGTPNLYTCKVDLCNQQDHVLDCKEMRVGFRRVRLVMAPNQWHHPDSFPKSRSYPPITLEINNRPIFAKGSNWVHPEIFPGIMTKETYRPLLELAKNAHMNLLRVWGGGIVNKESFFDLCDELGLMIWQEFPLACNNYPDMPDYLKVLDQESKSIIRRLRRHASLAIWCGGNELFNSWSGMTDQSHALRLLNANCYQLDQHTPFLPTSPLDGMAHGCYLFRYFDGREVFQVMPASNATAYTEFGVPGPSPVEYLKTFIPETELFPPKPGTAWETHHAFKAWVSETWLELPLIEEYFGRAGNLETLVARGEWLECEGYKCIFEEARRQKPTCSMALNWCFNEPWPSAANNSLINWPAKPKPAYYAVAASCRPSMASARIPKFRWKEGDLFSPEFWILHDGPAPLSGGTMHISLLAGSSEIALMSWDFDNLAAGHNLPGPIVRYKLPYFSSDRITLVLRVKDHPEMDSHYTLLYQATANSSAIKETPVMNL